MNPFQEIFEILGAAEMERHVHTVLGKTGGGVRSQADAFFPSAWERKWKIGPGKGECAEV